MVVSRFFRSFNSAHFGLLTAAGVLSLAASAQAAPFQLGAQTYDVEYVTGTGPNAAIVTIDFGPQAFNFGLNWDGTPPDGLASIKQIADNSNGALSIYTEFAGTFITGFKYDPYFDLNSDTFGSLTPGDLSDDYPNLWFGFYSSPDGTNWSMPDNGNAAPSDVAAINGEFFGWKRETTDWPGVALNEVSAIPEPASLGLLAIGAASLLMRRRRA